MKKLLFLLVFIPLVSFGQNIELQKIHYENSNKKALEGDFYGAIYEINKSIEIGALINYPELKGEFALVGVKLPRFINLFYERMTFKSKIGDNISALEDATLAQNIFNEERIELDNPEFDGLTLREEWMQKVGTFYLFRALLKKRIKDSGNTYDVIKHCTQCNDILTSFVFGEERAKELLNIFKCTQDDVDDWKRKCKTPLSDWL
jgi:hypothetical protein